MSRITKKTTKTKTTKRTHPDAPIPYVPAKDAPKAAKPCDRVRSLADLGITPAKALLLAEHSHDVSLNANRETRADANPLPHPDDDLDSLHEQEIALFGRIIHDSYGFRVVIVGSDASGIDDDFDPGSVYVIKPRAVAFLFPFQGPRVVDGIYCIGYVDDDHGRFTSIDAATLRGFAAHTKRIIPTMSRSLAREVHARVQHVSDRAETAKAATQ